MTEKILKNAEYEGFKYEIYEIYDSLRYRLFTNLNEDFIKLPVHIQRNLILYVNTHWYQNPECLLDEQAADKPSLIYEDELSVEYHCRNSIRQLRSMMVCVNLLQKLKNQC